ncbi:plasmid mobilization relaxosome protein MobC [Caballeronia sp. AZ7_KS35]|uniref:plasmid mobilization protein n=1 Tax=Caballeronia sp. AZ7_KS35 TaxID=2921762 RepID=UPI0020279140|nr:plasmid mobilization relaxosome protein MobC [Caballeronia sp. AZ7_KS35]
MTNATKAGRPTKPIPEKRGSWVSFRTSRDEDAVIAGKAAEAGLSVSAYCRLAALGQSISANRNVIPMEVIGQLRRLGNNLNQVLKEARFNNFPPDVAKQAESALREISDYLRRTFHGS